VPVVYTLLEDGVKVLTGRRREVSVPAGAMPEPASGD
jgi:hypothetical protein